MPVIANPIAALAEKNIDEVFASLKTSAKGLTPAEAARRLKIYGINEFAGRKKLQPFLIFDIYFCYLFISNRIFHMVLPKFRRHYHMVFKKAYSMFDIIGS